VVRQQSVRPRKEISNDGKDSNRKVSSRRHDR